MKQLTTQLLLLAQLGALAACTTAPPPIPTPPPVDTPDEPGPPVEPVWPDEAFRSTRPTPGPIAAFESPKVETFKLSNGLSVVLVAQTGLPVVAMELSFPFGESSDPVNKSGLAELTARLMNQGTESLDRAQLKERLSGLGSSMSVYAITEQSGIQARSLKRNLEPTLDLLVEVLTRPGMRKVDLERVRKELIADLVQQRGDIQAVGARLTRPMLFGQRHPYGHMLVGKSVASVSLKDCASFHAGFKPINATLFVVGAVTREELTAALEPRLSGWTGKARVGPKAGRPKTSPGTIYFVDVKGAEQSRVVLAHAGPGRMAPDYTETYLMSRILGGSFSSRINMNLREDKGWAYGARAGFGYLKQTGWFTAESNVDAPHTGEAVTELLAEMRKMKETSVTDAELTREREGTILSLPARFSTVMSTMGTTSNLATFGLPWDHYDAFQRDLAKAAVAGVDGTARKYLNPEAVVVIVVGDGETVRPQLDALVKSKALPRIKLVEVDTDGVPVRKR